MTLGSRSEREVEAGQPASSGGRGGHSAAETGDCLKTDRNDYRKLSSDLHTEPMSEHAHPLITKKIKIKLMSGYFQVALFTIMKSLKNY